MPDVVLGHHALMLYLHRRGFFVFDKHHARAAAHRVAAVDTVLCILRGIVDVLHRAAEVALLEADVAAVERALHAGEALFVHRCYGVLFAEHLDTRTGRSGCHGALPALLQSSHQTTVKAGLAPLISAFERLHVGLFGAAACIHLRHVIRVSVLVIQQAVEKVFLVTRNTPRNLTLQSVEPSNLRLINGFSGVTTQHVCKLFFFLALLQQ
mmetsp:Transcript_51976/g.90728  ORF Transcript_51976/g.90728 Transcript_51976/m.90728 type:complete len:210 (+) Transcript_51976:216-845(+)